MLPEPAVRLVEEHELLIAIEDHDTGGDAVERAVVGRDLAFQFALHGLDGGRVDRGTGRHAIDRQHDDIVRPAFAAGDDVHAIPVGLAAAERFRDDTPLAAVEQFDLLLEDFGLVLCFDGGRISRIHPDDAAIGPAQPHGHRQRVQQRAAGANVAREQLMLLQHVRQFQLVTGNILEAQYRAPARCPAFGLDQTTGRGAENDVE